MDGLAHAEHPRPPNLLDTSVFSSPEQAIDTIRRDRGFDEAAKKGLQGIVHYGGPMTLLNMFFASAVTRSRGLLEAIVREAEHSNPHAVYPLIRQLAEMVALVFYVVDHPNYVPALTTRPRDRKPSTPKRKSPQALVDYMDKHHAGQFGVVYAELCEMTHFGSVAMFAAHRIEDEDARRVSWASPPRWKDEKDCYIACAQVAELNDEMDEGLSRLAQVCVAEARSVAAGDGGPCVLVAGNLNSDRSTHPFGGLWTTAPICVIVTSGWFQAGWKARAVRRLRYGRRPRSRSVLSDASVPSRP